MTQFIEHPAASIGANPLAEGTVYIHESSYVDKPCQIGRHTTILPFSHVMAHSIIGESCHIGHNVTIASGVVLGNNVRVMNNVMLSGGVILEEDVYCGPSTVFTQQHRVRQRFQKPSLVAPSLVKRGSTIGANCTIAGGFTIGQYAFVEAGTVIDTHVPDFALVYGNPVTFVGWRCECGDMLAFKRKTGKESVTCANCGKHYRRNPQNIVSIDSAA